MTSYFVVHWWETYFVERDLGEQCHETARLAGSAVFGGRTVCCQFIRRRAKSIASLSITACGWRYALLWHRRFMLRAAAANFHEASRVVLKV